MKNVIKLDNFYLPWHLEQAITDFVSYYNDRRYHKSLGDVTRQTCTLAARRRFNQGASKSKKNNERAPQIESSISSKSVIVGAESLPKFWHQDVQKHLTIYS